MLIGMGWDSRVWMMVHLQLYPPKKLTLILASPSVAGTILITIPVPIGTKKIHLCPTTHLNCFYLPNI